MLGGSSAAGAGERPPPPPPVAAWAKKRQQAADYNDEAEAAPLSREPDCHSRNAAEGDDDEGGAMVMNRRQEEARVLRILQKRLALVAEERQAPPEIPRVPDLNQPTKLLSQLLRKKQPLEASPAWAQIETDWGDSEFISDCLRWQNVSRQKHSAEPLAISAQLCSYAQAWANHLAHTNTFYYRNDRQIGQNLFLRPTGPQTQGEISGRDVALHWYGDMRHYDFFQEQAKLHANVHAGHFTQMVWRGTKLVGMGKAYSRNNRLIVVANYYPPGNCNGQYQQNVRPPLPGSELRFDLSLLPDDSVSGGYSLASSTSSSVASSDAGSVASQEHDSLLKRRSAR